jgi:hypothetical protein
MTYEDDKMYLLGGYLELDAPSDATPVLFRFYLNPSGPGLLTLTDLPAQLPHGSQIAHFADVSVAGPDVQFALHAKVDSLMATVVNARLFVQTLPEFTVIRADRSGVLTVPNDGFFQPVLRSEPTTVDPISLGLPFGDTNLIFDWGFSQSWLGGPQLNQTRARLQYLKSDSGVLFDDVGIGILHNDGRLKLGNTIGGGAGRVGLVNGLEYYVELDFQGLCDPSIAGTQIRTDANDFEMVILPSTRAFLEDCPPGNNWGWCCNNVPSSGCVFECSLPLATVSLSPPSSPCLANTTHVFADGFETGDSLRWNIGE